MSDSQLERRSLLAPEVLAITGFAVAVLGLMGQNALTGAISTLLGARSESAYYFQFGVGLLVQTAVGAGLGFGAVRTGVTGWHAQLARAAVLVAALTAVAAVLMILGGLLHRPY